MGRLVLCGSSGPAAWVPRVCPAPGELIPGHPFFSIQHPEAAAASPGTRESGAGTEGCPQEAPLSSSCSPLPVRGSSGILRAVWSDSKTSGGPGLSLPRPRSAAVQGPVLGGDGLFGVFPVLILFYLRIAPDFRVINALSK